MGARDNLSSNRSRDEIDYDDEVRTRVQELRFEMLGAFAGDRYKAVIEELARIALDPRTPPRTRVVALQAYARAAGNLVAQAPVVNIAQGLQITAGDLLRLVPAGQPPGTTGCGVASSEVSLPPEAPTPVLQETAGPGDGDLGPVRPEVIVPVVDPSRCPACHARIDDEPAHNCPVEGL